MEDDGFVRVTGARVHNLRGVDVAMPRLALVAFTGVSGSGKSSLAFDTLYAHAQRQYFESVAPYARRLLHQLPAPDVDVITGMPPAVALGQRRSAPSSRSSVGTVTTMGNTLRMLLSRAGDYPDGARRLDSDSFSPNTVAGACPTCHGQGVQHSVTEASMVPDPSLSIREGAIASWPGAWQGKNLRDILATLGYDVDAPWSALPEADREWILFTQEQPVVTVHPEREANRIQRPYKGMYTSAQRLVLRTFAESKSEARRAKAGQFLVSEPCPVCHGKRLRPEALAVTFAGRDVTELAALPLTELVKVLTPHAPGSASGSRAGSGSGEGAEALLAGDLVARGEALVALGLGYLSLDRSAPTLSAGELQRLRLATQLRSGLFGVVYVLDEPSAGLHPADAEALVGVIGGLRDAGNSVLLVEHDLDVVRRADWVVDVGPGAGDGGGQVLFSGPVDELGDVEGSATGAYLAGRVDREPSRGRVARGVLPLRGVTRHNLRGIDVDVPLGVLTVVTGVSGAGKTSLLGVIAEEAEKARQSDATLGRVVSVDQQPIGRTPRSNLATYTGLHDVVRKLFAATDLARARGYDAGRFSFNVEGGRCPTCQGEGFIEVELLFLPTTYTPCPECHGSRYNAETLEVTYQGANIAQVLDMSVERAHGFLGETAAAARILSTLLDVGLGYLRLGQPATDLSGGEAQRVKLAAELQHARRARTLYLLDEPTTGLHPADTAVLMRQLHRLVDAGGTVVAAEHDLDVIVQADQVIDLGPGGGDQGGRVVAVGTPEQVAAGSEAEAGGSRTAAYVRRRLGG